jgi:hypothetical protein
MLVGDLNIAAEPRDVHQSMNYDDLYGEQELQVGLRLSTGHHTHPPIKFGGLCRDLIL